ncbi:MAG: SIMPL domain-containing protein, partial [Candidatus Dormiibacterota bacterium]
MTSTLRLVLIPLAVALACSLSVAAIVIATGRPPVLISSPSASTTTFETGVFTSGDAIVSVKPDLATVSAGVDSQQSTAAAAQSDLAAKAGKLIARIKALGVSDADLSTSGYWVGPVYAPGEQTITGYQATEVLRIQWHNVDTVGKTLDAIVQEGGATNISVGFGLADPKSAEAQARTLAIADAHSKAQAMASAAGVRLGQVLRVSDVST